MKRSLWLVGLLLLCGAGFADRPFPVGEELVYSITWNGVPVAWSKATVETETYEGREVIALRMVTRTHAFFDRIFKVDDFHESLVDPETFLPLRYTQNLCEGRYRCHEVTTFDFQLGTAHYSHQLNGKEKVYAIEPTSRDILCFMYFMRSVPLAENSENRYKVMTDEKIYELLVRTFRTESVDLPRYEREVESLEIRPEAMFDGLFVRNGKATVWVSRETRRLMTRARLSVPFGRVTVTLREVNGPGADFWITEKKDGDEDNN